MPKSPLRMLACLSSGRLALALMLALASTACKHPRADTEAPAKRARVKPLGSGRADRARFSTVLARSLARKSMVATKNRLVLFTQGEAIGIDVATGDEVWRRPLRPFGQPATFGDLVVVPTRGQRAVGIDAAHGSILWEAKLPGQALTGLAVSERWVIVTALADARVMAATGDRSVVAVLSSHDGNRRWQRRSHELLGVPAAVGNIGYLAQGHNVLALKLRTGRVLSQLASPGQVPLGRVERHGNTVLAGGENTFVDLSDGGQTIYRVDSGDGEAFTSVHGLEPGLGHEDGLRFHLLPSAGLGAPRNAVFLGRRAIVQVRLDPKGRPVEARWVHLRFDQHEYIAVHPTATRVLAVRDDGTLLQLDAATGREIDEHKATFAPLGSAFVGALGPALDNASAVQARTVVALLLGLLEDPDPRLLPVQRLAIDLLWRNEDPAVRTHVQDLARRIMRPDDRAESVQLREHANLRVQGVWGRADQDSVALLLKILAPKTTDRRRLTEAMREVVSAGGPAVIPKLLELLNAPGLGSNELVALARALRDLGDPRALVGVCEFIVRYHADPEVVQESKSIYYALEMVIAQALPEVPARIDVEDRHQAQQTLRLLLDDEFTVPQVRAFIEQRIPSRKALDGGEPHQWGTTARALEPQLDELGETR